ncbi:MAG: ABC transporter ATP-binding protein [Pikeienuella sp.]
MAAPPPVLSLRNVVATRGDFSAVVPALDVHAGDRLAIVGGSGSGKSTILDTLAGVLRPVSADRFETPEHDLAAAWARDDQGRLRQYRAGTLGYVLQTGGLAPFLSIAENVALPFWRDGRAPEGVDDLLRDLGLWELRDRAPAKVSVGQRQRAAIARALAGSPALILADEPTASLDADTAETVMDTLVNAAERRGAALMCVTHDPALAERHGLSLLRCGRVGPGRSALDELT